MGGEIPPFIAWLNGEASSERARAMDGWKPVEKELRLRAGRAGERMDR